MGADGDKTWYLFIRSHLSREARLDGSLWAYWSPDKDDVPPVSEGQGSAGEPPPDWTPEHGGTLAYRQYLQDVNAYHEHQWTQTVGDTTFEIGLRCVACHLLRCVRGVPQHADVGHAIGCEWSTRSF